MVTFTQWAKEQAERQDAVGYFARYWDSVTPGKISSIAGVRRHLDLIEHDRSVKGKPDDMADAAWDKAAVSLDAARSGLALATAEYTRMRAVENAKAHGLELAGEQPGHLTVAPVEDQFRTAIPQPQPLPPGYGTRIDEGGQLAALTDAIREQNRMLQVIYAELVTRDPDWDELWAIASSAAQEETP